MWLHGPPRLADTAGIATVFVAGQRAEGDGAAAAVGEQVALVLEGSKRILGQASEDPVASADVETPVAQSKLKLEDVVPDERLVLLR